MTPMLLRELGAQNLHGKQSKQTSPPSWPPAVIPAVVAPKILQIVRRCRLQVTMARPAAVNIADIRAARKMGTGIGWHTCSPGIRHDKSKTQETAKSSKRAGLGRQMYVRLKSCLRKDPHASRPPLRGSSPAPRGDPRALHAAARSPHRSWTTSHRTHAALNREM